MNVIIKRLLQEYPEAASEPNDEGELPLHKVCESAGPDHIPNKTIVSLLEAYPEASRKRDRLGNLPLHIAVNNAVESNQPLHAEYWMGLIKVLIESFPGAVSEQDRRGRTPFSSAVQIMDSLSHTRRQENDPVLEILEMLYDLHRQSVLERNSAHKNGLHFISQLFGDLGGMTPSAWKSFAVRVMRDYPELLTQTVQSDRTPLHIYVLFLGDTAIGARDNQDLRTRLLTQEIEEVLHTMITLHPESIHLREEYDLTLFDLINHKRLSYTRGSVVYQKSPIIKAVKQLLQRDEEYWEMAGELERAKISLRSAKAGSDSGESCIAIQKKLLSLEERMAAKLQYGPVSSDTDDNASCPEAKEAQSQSCPDEIALIEKITAYLDRMASVSDESIQESIEL